MTRKRNSFGWFDIVRMGLVQSALGSIVVLTTSTMNRVMVVELALPAMLPGVLVGLHYAMQLFRPRMGYGSDVGGRRTPWILGGMGALAAGAIIASLATALMATAPRQGMLLAVAGFVLIGLGVGACGTTLLVLMAKGVAAPRRAAAATIMWTMMIVGFVLTATIAGHFLDPFSLGRLVWVTVAVAGTALVLTVAAVHGLEPVDPVHAPSEASRVNATFGDALRQVWEEPAARQFAVFVFVSMLAYSAQDLILEPFAGTVFGLTPGESTQLSGLQHSGVLVGMVLVGLVATRLGTGSFDALRRWTCAGCIGSAAALTALALGGLVGQTWPLSANVFVLGAANGMFAVAAIGSMMALVSSGRTRREGVRMGLWGAAQAVAFGLGGFLGTAAVDLTRYLMDSAQVAYASVFIAEAGLFLLATTLATRYRAPVASPGAGLEAMVTERVAR